MSETVNLWRCRDCGKLSLARQRPRPHHRRDPWMEGRVRIGTLAVVCGPFIRYTATPDPRDAERPDPRDLGYIEKRWEWGDDDGLSEEYSRSIIAGLSQPGYDLYADDAAVPF